MQSKQKNMHCQQSLWEIPKTSLEEKINIGYKLLEQNLKKYNPSHTFCLFSGGHDSLIATHLTMSFFKSHPQYKQPSIVHIDTGIGIAETQKYVKMICQTFEWHLKIYKATESVRADGSPDPQIYENLVKERGFPGPQMHYKMYQRLKERQIAIMVRQHKQSFHDKIFLISGIRKAESRRRKEKVLKEGAVFVDGARVWLKVIMDFSDEDSAQYMLMHDLPRNPVKDNLCMSGECLCGAFAQKNELEMIEFFYPKEGARIRQLEKEVAELGFPWGWDEAPPKGWNQKDDESRVQLTLDLDAAMPLCHSCHAKQENI